MKAPVLFLLAMLGASAVIAAPLQDISSTSVTLEESQNSTDYDHLTVMVSRVDDLVDDNGAILIERIMGVKLGFDIDDEKVILNGAPLELGPSSIEVEAIILADESLVATDDSSEPTDLTPLTNSLDIGLVTVEVEATVERIITSEGIPIRHITVSERVIEINGAQVLQTEAQQHILDIYENGTIVESLVASDSLTTPLESPPRAYPEAQWQAELDDVSSSPCGASRWFLQINPHVRLAILGLFSSVILYSFVVIVGSIIRKRRTYAPVAVEEFDAVLCDQKDAEEVQIVAVEYVDEEKQGLLN